MGEAVNDVIPSAPAAHLAWWSGTLGDLHALSDERIVERLNLRLVEDHYTARADQVAAWRSTLPILRDALIGMAADWRVLLEYPLLRLGRRLDVVLVSDRAIFIIEFKTKTFSGTARAQTEDYALDLRDFHAGSRHHPVVPILVAGQSAPTAVTWPLFWSNYDNPLFEAAPDTLGSLLAEILRRIDHRGVNIDEWESAAYRPVPTIIEAAVMLYRKHGVSEIKAARADLGNLKLASDVILQAIAEAKAERRHIVVFVTGIPGAGKTLCGLDVVFSADSEAAFLTGTLPMVYVLKQALIQDAALVKEGSKSRADRDAKTKI